MFSKLPISFSRFAIVGLFVIPTVLILTPKAFAETPDAPVILEVSAGGCTPTAEICGDGIDQDCDGSDALCPGSDRDRDGYSSSQDCDDSNRNVYPGIAVACSAGGANGTKICQSSGAFTTCSTTPLCEATGSGRCFYISALTGSDSNAGSFNAPWKTYRNVITYDNSGSRPSGWVSLQAGDVVYFMSGVYSDVTTYTGLAVGVVLSGLSGTSSAPITIKAYPGAHPVIAPASSAMAMYLVSNNYLKVEGFEVLKAYGAGVYFVNGDRNEIRNTWIHDTDGVDNNNIAGLKIAGATNLNAHHLLIHDNYDRTCADTGGFKTENSRDVAVFDGGNIHIHHSVVFQSPARTADKTGACIVYKHGQTLSGGTFEVDNNILRNCYFTAIGTITYGGRFHHNLIIDSDFSISIKNQGSTPAMRDNIVEKNTFVNSMGFDFKPSEGSLDSFGDFTFRNNIVSHSGSYSQDSGGIVSVDKYGDNTYLNRMVSQGLLHMSNNCYYNPSTSPMFGFFAMNNTSSNNQGSLYSFSGWQAAGYDAGSVVANPQLDGNYYPQNSSCQGAGFYAP